MDNITAIFLIMGIHQQEAGSWPSFCTWKMWKREEGPTFQTSTWPPCPSGARHSSGPVFWMTAHRCVDRCTEYQALPVEAGLKYGANAWVHEGSFKKASSFEGCQNEWSGSSCCEPNHNQSYNSNNKKNGDYSVIISQFRHSVATRILILSD